MRPAGKIRSSPDCWARLHASLVSRETDYSGCTIFLVLSQEIITNLMTYSIYLIFLSSGGYKSKVKVFAGLVPLGGSEKHFIPYFSSQLLEAAWQLWGFLTCGCTTLVYATLFISSSPLLIRTPYLILRVLPTSTKILSPRKVAFSCLGFRTWPYLFLEPPFNLLQQIQSQKTRVFNLN